MSSYRKSSEAEEASTFRDAVICGKKIVEQEVRYCVVFGNRKHLPSRVMKNIAQKEQILEGGKERYWFSETFIPLYLIKEYEQKIEKPKPVHVLSKLQRRQLKASRKNIFSVLFSELGNTVRNCCSCHQEVFYRYFSQVVFFPSFLFVSLFSVLLLTSITYRCLVFSGMLQSAMHVKVFIDKLSSFLYGQIC